MTRPSRLMQLCPAEFESLIVEDEAGAAPPKITARLFESVPDVLANANRPKQAAPSPGSPASATGPGIPEDGFAVSGVRCARAQPVPVAGKAPIGKPRRPRASGRPPCLPKSGRKVVEAAGPMLGRSRPAS